MVVFNTNLRRARTANRIAKPLYKRYLEGMQELEDSFNRREWSDTSSLPKVDKGFKQLFSTDKYGQNMKGVNNERVKKSLSTLTSATTSGRCFKKLTKDNKGGSKGIYRT
jgi:hypothetical protein